MLSIHNVSDMKKEEKTEREEKQKEGNGTKLAATGAQVVICDITCLTDNLCEKNVILSKDCGIKDETSM